MWDELLCLFGGVPGGKQPDVTDPPVKNGGSPRSAFYDLPVMLATVAKSGGSSITYRFYIQVQLNSCFQRRRFRKLLPQILPKLQQVLDSLDPADLDGTEAKITLRGRLLAEVSHCLPSLMLVHGLLFDFKAEKQA